MNTYLRLGAAIVAVSALSGCATVMRGTKQSYTIASSPAGADVSLSIGPKCTTPCKLKLKRNKPFVATFTKQGYQPLEAKVDTKFNGGGAVAGNLILGGIIGAGVDASNGSLNTLTPSPLEVTLVPVEAAAAPQPAVEATPAAAAAPAATASAPEAPAAAPAPGSKQ
jgi:hypothetical protein